MTTGNQQYDFRTLVSGKLVGQVGSKIWTGTDTPKVSHGRLPPQGWTSNGPPPPKRYKVLADHPYSMSLKNAYSGLLARTAPGGFNDFIVTPLTLNFDPNNNFNSNDVINTIGKLKDAIQGSGFDMSIFLGTSHQTLRMLASNITGIAQALVFAKKGRMFDAAKVLGTHGVPFVNKNRPVATTAAVMSSRWLELQYGWKPLVQDIYDGSSYVAQQLSVPMMVKYRARTTKRAIVSIPPNSEGWKTQYGYHTYGIIASVKERLSLMPSLGLTDPVNLAWELLPWSFVIDWFVPIGDWLSAKTYVSRLDATYMVSGKTYGISKNYGTTAAGWSITPVGGAGYAKEVYFDRVVSASFSLPLPKVKSLEKVASWAHVRNAIALATQVTLGMRTTLR